MPSFKQIRNWVQNKWRHHFPGPIKSISSPYGGHAYNKQDQWEDVRDMYKDQFVPKMYNLGTVTGAVAGQKIGKRISDTPGKTIPGPVGAALGMDRFMPANFSKWPGKIGQLAGAVIGGSKWGRANFTRNEAGLKKYGEEQQRWNQNQRDQDQARQAQMDINARDRALRSIWAQRGLNDQQAAQQRSDYLRKGYSQEDMELAEQARQTQNSIYADYAKTLTNKAQNTSRPGIRLHEGSQMLYNDAGMRAIGNRPELAEYKQNLPLPRSYDNNLGGLGVRSVSSFPSNRPPVNYQKDIPLPQPVLAADGSIYNQNYRKRTPPNLDMNWIDAQ
jgi:hypothetical protein